MHRLLVVVSLIAALIGAPASAQRLGRITFPTSRSGPAQQRFLTGVLYLHSFEYSSALAEFRAAAQLDSSFAMAYWGEAMTHTHPVWNQQDTAAARAVLRRLGSTAEARAARAPTEREKLYLGAVEALYGDGSKAQRDTAYAARMETLARAYPADDEAQLFYALALLGLNQGERDVPAYMRAGAIALPIFYRNPSHPGAAHYLIHAFDDPVHAPLGLEAARAYGKTAPDAAHAQHMTSHIFLALGLWDDVVSANQTAIAVTERAGRVTGGPVRRCGHYPEWLGYGLLQQGRIRDAAKVLEACVGQSAARGQAVEGLPVMRAAFIVDARSSAGPPIAELAAAGAESKAYLAFGTGYAALGRGDLSLAREAVARLEAAEAEVEPDSRAHLTALSLELSGLVRAAEGDSVAALKALTDAARVDDGLPVPFGPPVTVKPPHEAAGELLLALRRWPEARAAFTAALARTPRRPAALLGLARALDRLGHPAEAADAYRTLTRIWRAADPELAKLALAPGKDR